MSYTDVTKVANAARNIEISAGLTATMAPDQANQFIDEAAQIIDSALSAICYTPLRQITRNNVTFYPAPIPMVATRLAAALMVRAVYGRIEPQASELADKHFEDGMNQLKEFTDGLLIGTRRIEGQDLKTRSNFANPYSAPLSPPSSIPPQQT